MRGHDLHDRGVAVRHVHADGTSATARHLRRSGRGGPGGGCSSDGGGGPAAAVAGGATAAAHCAPIPDKLATDMVFRDSWQRQVGTMSGSVTGGLTALLSVPV
ncbi:hypothetical protein GCM10009681_40610 [Luedemannella helvata]|uniref:Uncharacterized protein n=1 Tax=Luedemannella helvata TaxID=349315 RepID=A0ABP4X1D2_9ACTN